MTDFASLADRVERLTGPCRETDALIWWHTARNRAERVYWNGAMGMPKPLGDTLPDGLGKLAVKMNAPKFTESIDAAMKLVPEGWDYCLSVGTGEPAQVGMSPAGKVAEVEADAPTPALALTAAALRARTVSEAA